MKSFSFNGSHFGYLLLLIVSVFFAYLVGASGESVTTATTATTAAETTSSQYNVTLPTTNGISAVLQPLQAQLADINVKYASLIATNIELLCKPSLDTETEEISRWGRYGPCLYYSTPGDALYSLFFPCSNPNPRFEQSFPKKYWAGYYDSVDRSNNNYFGCEYGFASDVGLNFEFFQIWESKWSLILPNYISLVSEHQRLLAAIEAFKANIPEQPPTTTRAVSKGPAISLSCRDGMVLAYCQVYWSDGSYGPLPMGIGRRRGGVVDAIIYYDLQGNPSCILLYADGSILTSYDTNNCN